VERLAHGAGGKLERVKAEEALAGKTIGIYFSAHWCDAAAHPARMPACLLLAV